MKTQKVRAGGALVCNHKDGVIGAVLKYENKNCILTAFHVLRAGNCSLGDILKVNGFKAEVIEILFNYDIAVAEIYAHESALEFSNIEKPEIGHAYALKGEFKNPCNIMTLGRTYHYLSFSFQTLPLPGDSGSPIIQNGNVVGILASVFCNNAAGIAVSLERFRKQ
ncbi:MULTISPECIES: S1 family peptidase [Methanobacterium]|uniref:Uncharacterized protein n=1 Tax=Methanobacterium bryantii TaxID=2161 RepID=A0A2A2H8Y3_METBR|nr:MULTISPECIES: serine protease [Methanobacterium]OEC85693.1 hypothetical protein A9507_13130 [Methanobacterium sp. A39]PAV05872.1 hypothetical protein ASJ80_13490 [Methanobacterium bryantii]